MAEGTFGGVVGGFDALMIDERPEVTVHGPREKI
jgi:hypothetical protein